MDEDKIVTLEYRICWSSWTNNSFQGATDWYEAPGDTADEVEDYLTTPPGSGGICQGLEEALEASGFDWWVETRAKETT